MIKTVKDFAYQFESQVQDSTLDITTPFLIAGINWCLRDLPRNPLLAMLFSKHGQANLDAKGHYRWNLNDLFAPDGGDSFRGFRQILDTRLMTFWTTTGDEPCRLDVCNKRVPEFYEKNGIINLKKAGRPCEYTIERENDETYIVFDRPLNVPVIIDCIAGGILNEVKSLDDRLELSAVAENLMLEALRNVWYQGADDFAFSGAVQDYLDNKSIPEAIIVLNRNFTTETPVVLGG